MLVGLVALAFNLRPTAVAVGPVLDELRADLGMSPPLAGVLTSMPALAFAAFGALSPAVASRFGPHRTIAAALGLVVTGSIARTLSHHPATFLAFSVVALAGMAAANVLLPSLVRLHFPDRIGLVTSLYSTSLTVGIATAAIVTAPLAEAAGSWRVSFMVGTAAAAAALVLWLALQRLDAGRAPLHERPRGIGLARVARTRLGWTMAIFFGSQSAFAYSLFGWLPAIYRGAGFSPTAAGVFLGIATGAGIPLAFLLPVHASRRPSPWLALVVIVSFAVAGMTGILLAPRTLPWLWALFLAIGNSAFPLVLALIGLRARTPEGTAALSGFTQGVGYLVATCGPLALGMLRGATGGFTAPAVAMLCMLVPLVACGLLACRPSFLEDELRQA